VGMEIGYVVKDAKEWEVELERTAAEFDAGYYRKLLEKAWDETGFVFGDGMICLPCFAPACNIGFAG
jgi:hypothetical protein